MASLEFLYLIFLVTTTCPLYTNAVSDCNGTCTTQDDCSGQLTCIDKKCNDDPDVGTDICTGGIVPTSPPIGFISNCNGPCNNLGDCSGKLICVNGKCNDDPDVGTNICTGGLVPTSPPIGFISNCKGPCNDPGDCSGQLICIYGKCYDDPEVETSLCRGGGQKKKSNGLVALFITIPLVICIFLSYLVWYFWRKKHNKKEAAADSNENLLYLNLEIRNKQSVDSSNLTIGSTPGEEKYDFNLPQFSFSSISAATNNFSPENKLGEGGFGPVYKIALKFVRLHVWAIAHALLMLTMVADVHCGLVIYWVLE